MKTYKTKDTFPEVFGRGRGYYVAGRNTVGLPRAGEVVEIDGVEIKVSSVDAMMLLIYPPKPSDNMIIYGVVVPSSDE